MKLIRAAAALAVLLTLPVVAQDTSSVVSIKVKDGEPGDVTLSLTHEARAAVDRGTKWLVAQQSPRDTGRTPNFPP